MHCHCRHRRTHYTTSRFRTFCLCPIRLSRIWIWTDLDSRSQSHFPSLSPTAAQLASPCVLQHLQHVDRFFFRSFIHAFMCCSVSIIFSVLPCCRTVSNTFFFACSIWVFLFPTLSLICFDNNFLFCSDVFLTKKLLCACVRLWDWWVRKKSWWTDKVL